MRRVAIGSGTECDSDGFHRRRPRQSGRRAGAIGGGLFNAVARGLDIKPNRAARIMLAYICGLRDYDTAFGLQHKNQADIVAILTKYTSVKDAASMRRWAGTL